MMMNQDTRTALWASHSSINEYLHCPRAYYLHYVYRDPQTRHKVTLMSPPLALGQAVHDTLESLSTLKTEVRFTVPLKERFETTWQGVKGKRGGFANQDEEDSYKARGEAMIKRADEHRGLLSQLAVKIKMDLPYYWLSEKDHIILCGRIDWLQYFPDSDSVQIVDFKTGTREEKADSLQLPIYYLLTKACQKRPILGASYWYLDRDDEPVAQDLPDIDLAEARILQIAKEMALARKINRLHCPQKEGCRVCKPYEAILSGQAEFVFTNNRDQDVYILPSQSHDALDLSEVL